MSLESFKPTCFLCKAQMRKQERAASPAQTSDSGTLSETEYIGPTSGKFLRRIFTLKAKDLFPCSRTEGTQGRRAPLAPAVAATLLWAPLATVLSLCVDPNRAHRAGGRRCFEKEGTKTRRQMSWWSCTSPPASSYLDVLMWALERF